MKKQQNGLRTFIDKIKPNFTEGGRFAWLQSTFEAFETFAFTPNRVTKRGCHVRDAIDLKRAMITVVIALVPAMLFGMWNIGYQTSLHAADWPYELGTTASWWYCLWFGFMRMLPMLAVSYIVGLGIEFTFAQIKHHEVNEGFLVTGFLIPMIVPVLFCFSPIPPECRATTYGLPTTYGVLMPSRAQLLWQNWPLECNLRLPLWICSSVPFPARHVKHLLLRSHLVRLYY